MPVDSAPLLGKEDEKIGWFHQLREGFHVDLSDSHSAVTKMMAECEPVQLPTALIGPHTTLTEGEVRAFFDSGEFSEQDLDSIVAVRSKPTHMLILQCLCMLMATFLLVCVHRLSSW